ncbi:signal transduction histidine kinase [Promicromonospora sp. AC04]|uniref:sensor histidine kinase n=1 Tax=Promicromonospora sp. AC04 TaxID=2135723 RepID=UPI000D34DDF0|nr:sensor histidine kinase [Promicromonospora sp. AC04]PUB24931.1 signal transduction histidine kinase [Promicromonospora sp. AC04]
MTTGRAVTSGAAASGAAKPGARLPTVVGRSDFLWTAAVSMLAAFAMIALAVEANHSGVGPFMAYVVSSVSCAALPLALRHPIIATVVQCAATATLDLAGAGHAATEPFPTMTICVLVAHVALIALRHSWRIAVGAWWTLAGVSVLLVALAGAEGKQTPYDETLALVVLGSSSLIALIGGITYQYRLRIRGKLAAAQRDVEIEQERRTLVEERTRIARELHDVVAHSMSVIHMQATSAPYRLPDVDPRTREEFTTIAAAARGALGEMRQLLGVLRATDVEPETEPAPGLTQLPELVEATSRYGGPVTLVVEPAAAQVPDTVGTTVYRIVQEALSNVVRHAPGASATVRVTRQGAELIVTIVNTPVAPGSNGRGVAGSVEPLDDPRRPQLGVTGMRERVARLGGGFSHGPEADGGFRVTARLPLPVPDDGGDPAEDDDAGAGPPDDDAGRHAEHAAEDHAEHHAEDGSRAG